MQIKKAITLDLSRQENTSWIFAKQGDDGSRFVQITLTDNGEAYKPPAGASAKFRCRKPDGKAVYNPAQINSDGTVTVELTQQTLAASGVALADVSLSSKEGQVLSSVSFGIRVEPAPNGEEVPSTGEFLELQELVRRAEDWFGLVNGRTEEQEVALTDQVGYLLKASGNVSASSTGNVNRIVSEPVYAAAGETYLLTSSANYANALYVIYDVSGGAIASVVSENTLEGKVLTEEKVVMPEGTYYFRVACNLDIQPEGYRAVKVVETGNGAGGIFGAGIESIEQTVTSAEDGGINVIAFTLTDGTVAEFQVRNGGSGSALPAYTEDDQGKVLGLGADGPEWTGVTAFDLSALGLAAIEPGAEPVSLVTDLTGLVSAMDRGPADIGLRLASGGESWDVTIRADRACVGEQKFYQLSNILADGDGNVCAVFVNLQAETNTVTAWARSLSGSTSALSAAEEVSF